MMPLQDQRSSYAIVDWGFFGCFAVEKHACYVPISYAPPSLVVGKDYEGD